MPVGKSVLKFPKEVREFIDECVLSGMSPKGVLKALEEKYPNNPEYQISVLTLQGYIRNYLPPAKIVSPVLYEMKVKQLQLQFDAHEELQKLIYHYKYLLSRVLAKLESGEDVKKLYISAFGKMGDLLKILAGIQFELGILKREPKVERIEVARLDLNKTLERIMKEKKELMQKEAKLEKEAEMFRRVIA